MQKILLMTDSASDLENDVIAEYGIKLMPFNIIIGDSSFKECVDKTKDEVYQIMDTIGDIPKTSQVTAFEFEEAFTEAYKQGYTDVIYVSICGAASNTYNNSVMAKNNFFEQNPDAKSKIRIFIIDSKGYTAMYGYPIIEAAKKINKDADAESIVAYIEDWCNCASAYFIPMTLKYAKKSGRISAAAAFAGELLGLKPIIEMADSNSRVIEKIRGEKNIIPKLLSCVENAMTPQTPYTILMGKNDSLAKELEKEAAKKFGYKAESFVKIGAAISANAGNDIVGIAFRRNK